MLTVFLVARPHGGRSIIRGKKSITFRTGLLAAAVITALVPGIAGAATSPPPIYDTGFDDMLHFKISASVWQTEFNGSMQDDVFSQSVVLEFDMAAHFGVQASDVTWDNPEPLFEDLYWVETFGTPTNATATYGSGPIPTVDPGPLEKAVFCQTCAYIGPPLALSAHDSVDATRFTDLKEMSTRALLVGTETPLSAVENRVMEYSFRSSLSTSGGTPITQQHFDGLVILFPSDPANAYLYDWDRTAPATLSRQS